MSMNYRIAALAALTALSFAVEAAAWDAASYKEAAEGGDKIAQYNLGVCYERGYGVDKDLNLAFKWYKAAAENGYASAQYRAALLCLEGNGTARDPQAALDWARKAANDGNTAAAALLGKTLWRGDGVEKDPEEGAKWLLEAAGKGDAEAQFLYSQILSSKELPSEAKSYLEKSATQSFAPAQIELAQKLLAGPDAEKQGARALQLLDAAAKAGDVNAKKRLAKLLCDGAKGVKADKSAALVWIEALANDGDLEMARLAADIRLKQPGAEAKAKALDWLRTLSDSGDAKASFELGRLLQAAAPEQAAELFRKAATAGNAEASYEYALCLQTGRGVESSEAQAFDNFTTALAGGCGKAAPETVKRIAAGAFPSNSKIVLDELLLKAVELSSDAKTLALAGDLWRKGRSGLPANEAKAKTAYEKAVGAGAGPDAAFQLGVIELRAKNAEKAASLFKKAADAGSPEASYQYALLLGLGQGSAEDKAKIDEYMKKAADAGIKPAVKAHAKSLLAAKGAAHDAATAFAALKPLAEAGDAEAARLCAETLLKGDGVAQDAKEAGKLFKQAAEKGDAEAAFQYAKLQKAGKTEEPGKPAEVYAVICKAAASGNMNALFEKGECLASGYGVADDSDAAFLCYLKAGDAGEINAILKLISAYEKGEGTLRDVAKRFEWTVKAAEAGRSERYLEAGIAFATGKGVDKNPESAFKWYSKAAEKGEPKALYYLGVCYMKGFGTAKNEAKAKELLTQAAKAAPNDKEIKAAIDKLETPEQPPAAKADVQKPLPLPDAKNSSKKR